MSTSLLVAIGAGIAVLTGIGQVLVLVKQQHQLVMQLQDSLKQKEKSVSHFF